MIKLAKLREDKRLEYEAYHSVLTEELTKKTKLFCETTTLFEKAVQDYQRLFDSRFDVAETSTGNVLTNSADVSATHVSFSAEPENSHPDPIDIELLSSNEDCLQAVQPSQKPGLPNSASYVRSVEKLLNTGVTKSTLAEEIETARLNCQSFKKRYTSLEASSIQARNRIEAARKEYYKSLLLFDKLEKDLLSVSSAFESQKRIDIENNFKKLGEKEQPKLPIKALPRSVSLFKSTTALPQVIGVKRKASNLEPEEPRQTRAATYCPPAKKSVLIEPQKPSQRPTYLLTSFFVAPLLCVFAPTIYQAFQNFTGLN